LCEALDRISVRSRDQHGNEKHSTKPPAQADKRRKERNAKWKKYEYEVDIRPGKQTENDMPETTSSSSWVEDFISWGLWLIIPWRKADIVAEEPRGRGRGMLTRLEMGFVKFW
jgi:hypothetical protein